MAKAWTTASMSSVVAPGSRAQAALSSASRARLAVRRAAGHSAGCTKGGKGEGGEGVVG